MSASFSGDPAEGGETTTVSLIPAEQASQGGYSKPGCVVVDGKRKTMVRIEIQQSFGKKPINRGDLQEMVKGVMTKLAMADGKMRVMPRSKWTVSSSTTSDPSGNQRSNLKASEIPKDDGRTFQAYFEVCKNERHVGESYKVVVRTCIESELALGALKTSDVTDYLMEKRMYVNVNVFEQLEETSIGWLFKTHLMHNNRTELVKRMTKAINHHLQEDPAFGIDTDSSAKRPGSLKNSPNKPGSKVSKNLTMITEKFMTPAFKIVIGKVMLFEKDGTVLSTDALRIRCEASKAIRVRNLLSALSNSKNAEFDIFVPFGIAQTHTATLTKLIKMQTQFLDGRCTERSNKELSAIPNRQPLTNVWQQRAPPNYVVSHNDSGTGDETVVTTTSAGSTIDKGNGTVATQRTDMSTIEAMITEKIEAMHQQLRDHINAQIQKVVASSVEEFTKRTDQTLSLLMQQVTQGFAEVMRTQLMTQQQQYTTGDDQGPTQTSAYSDYIGDDSPYQQHYQTTNYPQPTSYQNDPTQQNHDPAASTQQNTNATTDNIGQRAQYAEPQSERMSNDSTTRTTNSTAEQQTTHVCREADNAPPPAQEPIQTIEEQTIESQWTLVRNRPRHGIDTKDTRLKVRGQITDEVRRLYAYKDQLKLKDQYIILSRPIETVLSWDTDVMEIWADTVRTAIKTCIQKRANEEATTGIIYLHNT